MDCIFCKIAKKEINSQIVYEDDQAIAFKDTSPQAPVHLLVIPKEHIDSLNEISIQLQGSLLNHLFGVIQKLAHDFHVDQKGYRTVINCNQEGGQTVYHLHIHLLGGRQLGGLMG